MKKAQLYGQIFVYILSLVLISFILIYGYNSIKNFKQKAEQVSCLKFKNDLRNSVDSILSDYGSVQRKDLQVCSGYNQVCFVESYQKERNDAPQGSIDPIIRDSWESCYKGQSKPEAGRKRKPGFAEPVAIADKL